MKINWKVRFKNPVFWLTITPTVLSFAYTVLGWFEIVPPISQDALVQVFSTIITGLTTLGVLVDPTTKGAGDSSRAMTYNTPQ